MPTDPKLNRGDEITVDIETLADAGDGLARVDGFPVFVPGTLAGERVKVRIVAVHDARARGETLEIEVRSPDREDPPCALFGTCAGCRLQHIGQTARRSYKRQRLETALRRHMKSRAPDVGELQPVGEDGLRCRLPLRVARRGSAVRYGLADQTGLIITLDECPATDPRAVAVARAIADEAVERRLEALKSFVVHVSADGREVHATLVADTARLPHAQRLADVARDAGATGLALNQHEGRHDRMFGRRTTPLWGRPFLIDRIGDLRLRISATTFFEATHAGALGLGSAVERAVDPGSRVLDLFAGSGAFALRLARAGCEVTAVETSHQAVHDADGSAHDLGLSVRFIAGRAEEQVVALGRYRPDVVVVDPTAAGCGEELVAGIARILTPRRIVMIGRDPGTVGRDVARFTAMGFRAVRVDPVDVDPMSRDVAAAVTLDRDAG